jgi:hypothetical protein
VADKSSQVILLALSRAAAAPAGLPLHGTKTVPGLFATNAAGKQAAQRCQEEGYLSLLAEEQAASSGGTITLVKKKSPASPLYCITEKGLAYLLGQVSPRQVLEDFVRALDAGRQQADELLNVARRMQQGIESLKSNAEKVLQYTCRAEASSERGGMKALFAGFLQETEQSAANRPTSENSCALLVEPLLAELTRWEKSGASEDCPLPHLYRQLSASSIGQFHDTLRRLHELGKIYLHPWTGPLYDIPEPPYALLIGHEIAYYASIRK